VSDFLQEFPDEGSQNKEIYAYFGLAAYLASVFEEGVAIETTMLQLIKDLREHKIATKLQWEQRHDEQMARAHKLPLGPALARLASLLELPLKTRQLFDEALRTRNYLIHHFFRDEIHEFYTAPGRERMYAKLKSYVDLWVSTYDTEELLPKVVFVLLKIRLVPDVVGVTLFTTATLLLIQAPSERPSAPPCRSSASYCRHGVNP